MRGAAVWTAEMKGLAATLLASALILAPPLSAMPLDEGADYLQPGHRFADSADHITQECEVVMNDAFSDYDGNNLTFTWNADLTCHDAPHYLTVKWTIYESEGGHPLDPDFEEELRYLTSSRSVDYVNLTMVDFPPGRYDILSTYYLHDLHGGSRYAGHSTWYDYGVGDNTNPPVFAIVVSLVILVLLGRVVWDRLE